MVLRVDEMLLNGDHLEDCLGPSERSFDKVGLTPVNPGQFEFGAAVMRKSSHALTITKQ